VLRSLLGVRVRGDADVGEQLALEHVARKGDAVRPGRARRAAPLADVVQGGLLGLDGEGLLQGGAQRLQQLGVPKVGGDVFHHLPVRPQAERAEDDHDRHVRPDVRERRPDGLPPAAAPRRRPGHELDGQGGRRPGRALRLGADLGVQRVLAAGGRAEHVHVVVGHPLLGDQHLFGAVDDEVAALVERALAQGGQVGLARVGQGAVGGAQHDGDLPDEDFGKVFRLLVDLLLVPLLLALLPVAAAAAAAAGRHRARRLLDVHVQRSGVGEGAQAGFPGEEDRRLAVRFRHRRAGQVHLAKLDGHLGRGGARPARARGPAVRRVVLGLGADRELAHLVHHFLL